MKNNHLQEKDHEPYRYSTVEEIEDKNLVFYDFSTYHKELKERKNNQQQTQAKEVNELKIKLESEEIKENRSEDLLVVDQIKGPGTLVFIKPNKSYIEVINKTSELNGKNLQIGENELVCEIHIGPNSNNSNLNTSGNPIKIVNDLVGMLKNSIEKFDSDNKPKYIIGFSYLTPLLTKILQRKYKLQEGVDFDLMKEIPDELIKKFHLNSVIGKDKYDVFVSKLSDKIGKKTIQQSIGYIHDLVNRSEKNGDDEGKFTTFIKKIIQRRMRKLDYNLQHAMFYQNVKKKYTTKDAQLLIMPVETIQKLL